jgi:hypothetical protein
MRRNKAMTTHEPNPSLESHDAADRDILISRVVDGRASATEWTTLETMAGRDPGVWRELATAQRDQRAIEMIVNDAGNAAESVDLPMRATPDMQATAPWSRLRIWGGWMAAAVLAFAAAGQYFQINLLKQYGTSGGNTGGPTMPVGFTNADAAFDEYQKLGKRDGIVVGELPDRVLLSAQPATDGEGYDVMVIRQVVERRRVKDVLQFPSRNELGETIPVARPLPVTTGQSRGL